jgi:hypothetical protein
MIKEKKFRSFKKFWCFIEELNAQNNNFIWRGHSNKNWILNTTWNRYRKIFNDIEMTETLIKFEQNLARGGFFPFEKPVSKFNWLELIRHYGISTLLINLSNLYFPLSFVSDILYRLDLMNINGVNLYMDEIGAVIDTKNMKNYNSVFGLNDSKIIKDENV